MRRLAAPFAALRGQAALSGNVCAAAVFLAAFALNLSLAHPAVAPFRDAGDLAAASTSLGVAHPPGYPLYVLLGHAFQSAAPFGNPAYRLNALSAVAGAAACLFLFLILLRHAGSTGALLGVLVAALLPPALSQNGLSEVYALNAAFTFGLLWAALDGGGLRRWMLLSFLFGIGLGNHQTLVLAAPVFLLLLDRERKAGRADLSWVAPCLWAALAGFSVHLLLPLRASADHAWGEVGTLSGLWNTLTRADYGAVNLSSRYSTDAGAGLVFWFKVWFLQWGAAGALLTAAASAVALSRNDRGTWGAPLLLLWVFAGPVFALAARLEPGELSQAILVPAFVVPGLAAAGAVGVLVDRCLKGRKTVAIAVCAGFALFLARNAVPGVLGQNHRGNLLAHDYGRNLLRTVPGDSVLLMISDTAVMAVSYQQTALRQRADLKVLVDAELPWRWRLYRRRFPDLFADGQPDGGLSLVRHQAGKPVYTEGIQAKLMDALCPVGLAARVEWPRRSPGCVASMEGSAWLWQLYARRVPSSLALYGDYYSRALLKTVSSGAYNAGLLLGEAGRADASRAAYARSLFWNPEHLLRWEESF